MGQRVLSVALRAQVEQYVSGMGRAAAATDGVTDAGRRLSNVGKGLTAGLTVPMATIGAVGLRSAIGFQSAFTGVQKTVDATTSELARLKDGIIDMSGEIPTAREEIAAVAEAAGQLGIETPRILEFTRTIVDLGNATNLVGEQGATMLAQFANVTQMDQANFSRLGSSIVALGNAGASTEAAIVEMSMRIAGAGAQVKMTESQIVGLAAGLANLGIPAEMGGSAVSRVILRMQRAVIEGSDSLAEFARVAGVSGDEFAAAFSEDASQALVLLLNGLQRISAEGGSTAAALDGLGLAEERTIDTMNRLAGAGDSLQQSIALSGKAWSENSALANEASLRYSTAESRIRMAVNKVTEVGRKIGDLLIPMVVAGANVVGFLADGAGALIDVFSRLPQPVQIVAGSILGLAMAVGPTILSLTKLVQIGALLMKSMALSAAWQGLSAALKGVSVSAALTNLSFARLAGSLSMVSSGVVGWTRNLMGAVAVLRSAMVTGQGFGAALAGVGAAIGPQIALAAALAAVAGAIYMVKRAHDEMIAKNRTATESATALAESVGLATAEIRALNAAIDETGEAELTDRQFALDNSDAIKTLRELETASEEVAQGRLMEIAYSLRLQGNSPEEIIEHVTRLGKAAGIVIPAELTVVGVDDFENQVAAAKLAAENVWNQIRQGSTNPETTGQLSGAIGRQVTNIGQRAAEAYATGSVDQFVRVLGEAEAGLNNNETAVNHLSDEFLKLSGVQGVSIRSAKDLRGVIDELSRSSSVSADDKDLFASWVDATTGMDSAAASAEIMRLASEEAEKQLEATGGAASEMGAQIGSVGVEEFTAGIDRMAGRLAFARLDFDAGAAAVQGYADAIDMATTVGDRLSAGIAGGRAFKSLREGMTGEKAIADIMSKTSKATVSASSAVDRLADSARRADPKMAALQTRLDALAAAGDAFASSIDNSSMLDDQIASALNLGDAYREFEGTFRRLPMTLDMTAMATGKLRPRTAEAVQNMLNLGKAARDYLATLVEMGRSESSVRGEAARMRTEYEAMFREMGMGETSVRQYIEAMGLLPSQVDTAIRVSGLEMAKVQLDAYLQLLDGRIPAEVATSVIAELDSGNVEAAAKQLAAFAASNPTLLEVGVDDKQLSDAADQIREVQAGLWELPREFDPLKAMLGEYTDAQMSALDAVMQFGDSATTYLSRVAHDGNVDEIRDQAYLIRDAFLGQLESFGIVGDAAQQYLDLIGLSDWQIESAITLSGDTEAMFRIQMYSQFMADEIPSEVMTEVLALIDENKLAAASDRLAEWREEQSSKPVDIQVWSSSFLGGWGGGFAPGVQKRARGGPFGPGWLLTGENGPELMRVGMSGRVFDASDTARMLAPGVPVGSNLSSSSSVSLDERSLRALEAVADAGQPVQFGDINVVSPVERDTPRRIAEKVGASMWLGGRR